MRKLPIYVLFIVLMSISSMAIISGVYSGGEGYVATTYRSSYSMKGARSSVYVEGIGYSGTREFNIKPTGSLRKYFTMDSEKTPGYYPVRITLNDGGHREIKYTWVYIE